MPPSTPRPDPQIRFITVDGLRLRVQITGSGSPLLLMHGIGANIEMWRPLLAHLRGFEVIAFDAPGTGESDTPALPRRLPRLAAMVAALLDELGYPIVDVLGYSFGGALAQQFAHQHSSRVRRLVIAGSAPGLGSIPGNPLAWWLLLTPLRFYSLAHLQAIAPIVIGGRTARDRAMLADHAADRFAKPPTVRGYSWQFSAAVGWSSLTWLHTLPHQTLVMTAGRDPLDPVVNARIMACLIPNAKLRVIPGAGHLFLLDEPAASAPHIVEFLSQDGADGDTADELVGARNRRRRRVNQS